MPAATLRHCIRRVSPARSTDPLSRISMSSYLRRLLARALAPLCLVTTMLLLTACAEGETSPTGPGDDDPFEPAMNEIVTTLPLNSSSNDTLVYFSFATGKLVSRSAEWDLALRRYEIRVNSAAVAGTASRNLSGYSLGNNAAASDAQVLAFTAANQRTAFDNVREAQIPADAEFESDRLTENSQAYLVFGAVPAARSSAYWMMRLSNGSFAAVRAASLTFSQSVEVQSLVLETRLQTGTTLGATQAFTIQPAGQVVHFNLATRSVVTPDGCNWDLRFDPASTSLSITLNTACNVGSYPGPGSPTFAAVTDVSNAPQYVPFLSQLEGPIPFSIDQDDAPFRYNLSGNNRLHPTFNVYLVKSGTRVYKVQATDYYNDTGTSGHLTLRYARIR